MKNYIAFDIGNVLFHFNATPFLDCLLDLKVLSHATYAHEFLSGSFQHIQELGIYDIRNGIYKLNQFLNDDKLDIIQQKWNETFYPSKSMIELVEELISKNWNVALLSNIGQDHAKLVLEKAPIFNECIKHFSCEVGVRKPTKLFFQSFDLQYGNEFRGCKYFDDKADNINGGFPYFTGKVFDLDNYICDEEAACDIRSILEI